MISQELEGLKARAFERFPIAFVLTNPRREDNPIVYVNRAFERLTGYSEDSAIGRNCRFLQGENTDSGAVARLSAAIKDRRSHKTKLINVRADGSEFMNELIIEPIYDDNGELCAFLGLQRRADDRSSDLDRAESQLVEIQHRVKNHLQMVVSMIRLQSQKAGRGDPGIDYEALAYRIETLQLLYQEMNRSGEEADVPMGAYISRIATTIGHLESRENIRLNIATESFYVPVETAARIGLIASEIVTNAFQHAFQEKTAGLVEVGLRQLSGGIMRLEVMDDGVGLPEGSTWPEGNTMGASIVSALLEGIEGKMNIARGVAGTTFTVDVPLTETRAKHEN